MMNNGRGGKDSNEIYSYSPQAKKAARKAAKKKMNFPWKGTVAVVLSVLLCFSGIGMIIFYTTVNSINFKDIGNNGNVVSSQNVSTGSSDITTDTYTGELLNDHKVLNVMLFGEDSVKDGETQGRSDTMLLLSIDNRQKKLKLTSYMRDMLVTIPGNNAAGSPYGLDKLNASYTYGGPELAIKTVETNFGVKIDRYAVVDFESFKSIIDCLGGLDIELTQDEIDYINWQTYLNGQSDLRYEITDAPGVVHLNGRQALWYARDRGYQDPEHPEVVISGDDFDRTTRQRNMIKTLMTKFKSANLAQIVKIVGEIGPMITTNLKKDEITTLVANSLTYLSYDEDEFSLPLEDGFEYGWYKEQSVLMVNDWDRTRYELAQFIFEGSVVQNYPTSPTTSSSNDTNVYSQQDNYYNQEDDNVQNDYNNGYY
ncbi:MAG TPA: hypothetical protein GX401_08040 [Clostridiales bacterium]|nr:hypothetical protein [Clostridiales bacterium]